MGAVSVACARGTDSFVEGGLRLVRGGFPLTKGASPLTKGAFPLTPALSPVGERESCRAGGGGLSRDPLPGPPPVRGRERRCDGIGVILGLGPRTSWGAMCVVTEVPRREPDDDWPAGAAATLRVVLEDDEVPPVKPAGDGSRGTTGDLRITSGGDGMSGRRAA
ncbi:hypothetical protein GCM10011360_23300 [Primorskyibacter flagellatus]|uniref:Uncharacterized protein n=1 Tax=Primorskyibacter flagellatus TaxID=1387277 RepID=A0A917A8F7_9RHOB|nr:hypothetical protein GCM10011360_23300 [Primorskyibacter flagellatus]